jgi:phosphoribosylformylglycinamidine synthase|tara:strand:+ start:968 stop:1225 length:258 start_codon:yes stop_codon:yes gene_type:complete
MKFKAEIFISLKPTVSDPQGMTIAGGLEQLGFESIEEVRAGKFIEMSFAAETLDSAKNMVADMCGKLLANPTIENYRFEIKSADL